MQIQLGNFGNAIAQPQQAAQVVPQQAANQGLANVAQAGQQLATTFQAIDEQKQRMQAVSSLANLNNDLHDIHDSIARDVAGGVIKPENALDAFNARAADARKARTDGLNPFQQETIDSHITTAVGSLTRNLQSVAIKKTESDIGAQILDTGESLQRQAMRDLPTAIAQYDALAETMGPKAGWNSIQIAKAKQGFKESASFNFANATLEGAVQTGDKSLVQAALDKIQGPDGEVIDPNKRTALVTKAYGYLNGIDAATQREADRAQREQDARENHAVDVYNSMFDLVAKGRYLSTEAIAEGAAATAGTKMASQMQELVKSQGKVAGFAALPLPQMRATVERMNAAGSDPSIGVTPQDQKVTEQFKSILSSSEKAYADNPWQAAQERGVIKDAPTIQMNSIQDAQQVLTQRMQQIGQVEIAAGRKVSPLQPQEAEQIARVVRMLLPDQQSSALASIGTIVPDSDRLAALAKQMHDKDNTLGLAMMLAGERTTEGRYSSELLLRGDRAIKDKAIMMDTAKETGWRGSIANLVGDAFPNQEVRQQVIDSAYLINAGIVAGGGSSDPARALRLTVGSIVERNGVKVPLPRGMEEGDFDKRLKAITPADIAAQTTDKVYVGTQSIPVADFVKQLPNAALISAGQGRYNVKAGGTLVTNSQGQRITIRIAP
ncbi:hypothetical protein [Herbaspirillum sp. C7C8]|uniref:hypothetical protein n=1 Tax=Herbaspirillum sp. C7C8 TaxID=2736665 RepID=UPI001F518FB4|nr:hypothetical protein [Herbaspirillum sp. C7C8]MCI1005206.1 hypothetical protein [Herbaspirillum sp. C7C8]